MKLLYGRPRWFGISRTFLAAAVILAIAAALALFASGDQAAEASHGTTSVGVGSDWFCDTSFENGVHTATIDEGDSIDWGGASNIYSGCVGNWNGFHTVTECSDNTFSSCASGQSAGPIDDSGAQGTGFSYTVTFNTAGTYYYLCTIHPSAMRGEVVVQAAPADLTGPATSSVAASPNPTNGASSTTLTATVDDSATGNSNIAAAEYFVDTDPGQGLGTAMSASDTSFDSATENVTASVDVSGLADGTYTLYVRGQDSEGNWGATDSVVLTVSPVPAGAESATITIAGGTLALATNPIDFGAISLTGVDQTVDTQPAAWAATDARGSGAGWNVTLTSTDFTTTGGTITVDNFKMKLDDANVLTVSGNTAPTSQVTSYQPLDNVTPLKLLSAAASAGMGTYDFTPDARLIVAAESAPGDYTAFMTVTINSGP